MLDTDKIFKLYSIDELAKMSSEHLMSIHFSLCKISGAKTDKLYELLKLYRKSVLLNFLKRNRFFRFNKIRYLLALKFGIKVVLSDRSFCVPVFGELIIDKRKILIYTAYMQEINNLLRKCKLKKKSPNAAKLILAHEVGHLVDYKRRRKIDKISEAMAHCFALEALSLCFYPWFVELAIVSKVCVQI